MSAPSIKRRLLLGTGLAAGALFSLGSLLVYLSIQRQFTETIDETILSQANLIAVETEIEEGELIYDWKAGEGSTTPVDGDFYFQMWDLRSGHPERSHSLGDDSLPRPTTVPNEPTFSSLTLPNGRRARTITMQVIPHVDEQELEWAAENNLTLHPESMKHVLLLCHDSTTLDRSLHRIRRALIIGGTSTFIFLGLIIHFVISRSLRPLQALSLDLASRSAERIGEPMEIPPSLPIELRPQTEAFNQLLARIGDARRRDRDFALHASHELRTPIAGVQAILENSLAADRPAEDYRSRINQALDIVIPLRDSVARVLYLARIQSGESILEMTSCSPLDILHEIWTPLSSIANRNSIHVNLPPKDDALSTTTDIPLLRILLSNLLDNAIRHSPPQSTIEVTRQPNGLRITNPAPDITQHDIERAFEPFVQLTTDDRDPTSGIGLTLCREIAKLLAIELQATVSENGHVTFSLEFQAE